ncbi:molybdate transport system ATP-binding protein [Microbacterium sp. SORGH_AS428]|uniref:ABC transporter ATP-binding protein n=1 Tax=Microbacterium sp. SORGH_AS_0428 TaxID=3041788 RepID=UPI00285B2E6C|nr:ABC transporter ATP-binding protein [Microbacterium sp. SORGH_AS_0428]MDR6200670.1 molybdate transport system ATP-binding protein [Microbacterium sp. SORGH_AS_0428]
MTAVRARIRVSRPGFELEVPLVVASGETVAIMGPSGAGKSTMLDALAGLVPLSEGRIVLDEDEVSTPRFQLAPARRGTVLLGQDPHLFPHLSARENVAFGPRAAGMPARAARALAEEWLVRVGLPDAGKRRPADLSGGQQQRVAIARALAASPRLVLLDEPLTSLDPVTADGIRALLAEHLAGRTCVLVTHDAVDAVAFADRVAVIEAGRLTQEGAVRDVLGAPATAFVASLAGLNRIVGAAAVGGVRVDGMLIQGRGDVGDAAQGAAVFRPADVRIVGDGTPGSWVTRIVRVEPTIAGARVHTATGGIAVDVSLDELAARGLRAGAEIALSVDPRSVRVVPA